MKKVYQKPDIVFESFALSMSIAAGCESVVNNSTYGECGIEGTGEINLFSVDLQGKGICTSTPEGLGGKKDEWDGFCYHVPTQYSNFFNS